VSSISSVDSQDNLSSPEINPDDFTLVVFYSLLGGSTSLIPIPILDDWIYSIVRRQMIQAVLIRRNVRLPFDRIRELAAKPSLFSDEGCLKVGGTILFWWPVRFVIYVVAKLFKKIFFFLAIKEATDRASELFHSGYLLDYGATRIKARNIPAERWIVPFRSSLWEINDGFDTSPVRSIFWAALRFNRQILKKVVRLFRSATRFFLHSRKDPLKREKTQEVIDEQ